MTDKDLNPNDYPEFQGSVLGDGNAPDPFDYEMPTEDVFKKNNLNIFQIFDMFAKESFFNKADRKDINNFKRDLELESKLLDESVSIDELSTEEKLKVTEYFKLITKLTPKMEKANPDKINGLINKYSRDNNGKVKPFKKKRFRDIKKQLK